MLWAATMLRQDASAAVVSHDESMVCGGSEASRAVETLKVREEME